MARRIIWSNRAIKERQEIFNYWNNRTHSKTYSKKLNRLFQQAIDLLSNYPQIGRKTTDKSARIKVVRDYL